jgi:hypothetical protein
VVCSDQCFNGAVQFGKFGGFAGVVAFVGFGLAPPRFFDGGRYWRLVGAAVRGRAFVHDGKAAASWSGASGGLVVFRRRRDLRALAFAPLLVAVGGGVHR